MYDLSLFYTRTISTNLNYTSIMLRRLLAEGAGHFFQPAEFENVANPDFENIKHLQNQGHLLLTETSMNLKDDELYTLHK